ncbi:PhzF family phenazine biosynthesis protein [Dermacoccus sp. PE3]|uniref:PhzF family phenazine biosynthesis protein n=1 Tax=Dermacoccus sp. PE3 TaxID=1641401 RepID=UPI00069B535D|nr:PhzF family phenazine biosynthesis protein [Dermacoccus sp. PE3]
MKLVHADMFGADAGSGSPLLVLIPDEDEERHGKSLSPDDLSYWATAWLRKSGADEVVLVTDVEARERSCRPMVFGARGVTPFITHSMAGVATALVSTGALEAGSVTLHGPDSSPQVWTDGSRIEARLVGPVIDDVASDIHEFRRDARAWRVGIGRGFLVVDVDDHPLQCPAPDVDSMERAGLTDLTYLRWAAGESKLQARVFAPGFGMPEDAGCLPVAGALSVSAFMRAPRLERVEITQVSGRGSCSHLTAVGTVRDGHADVVLSGRVHAEKAVEVSGPPAQIFADVDPTDHTTT